MADTQLPRRLERNCCRGKSCGKITLWLDSLDPVRAEGDEAVPTLYRYRRVSNDNGYGPEWSTRAALAAWIEESAAEEAADDAWFRQAAADEAVWLAEQGKK